MTLTELKKYLGLKEDFHPMEKMDWETFGGANPGTYIAYDEGRIVFAEPNGTVAIMIITDDDDEPEEINFELGPYIGLTGFSEEAVAKNVEYHAMVTVLEKKIEELPQ